MSMISLVYKLDVCAVILTINNALEKNEVYIYYELSKQSLILRMQLKLSKKQLSHHQRFSLSVKKKC